jgi:transcription elongation factor S-II
VREMMTRTFSGSPAAETIGTGVETAIYTHTRTGNRLDASDESAYKDLFKVLKINLSRNPELREAVVDGRLTPHDLVRLGPTDMISRRDSERMKRLKRQALEDVQVPQVPMDETDQFQCTRCKQRRCVYFQKQTRCADEPMTTFVQCRECKKTWRC